MAKFVTMVSGVPRMQTIPSATLPSIYDEQFDVVSPTTAGTSVTLPVSGTYTSDELEIYLNGQKLLHVEDYTYVGSPPRTQVQFTFDLVVGDKLLFRKIRDF
jgi:hypothetical protein